MVRCDEPLLANPDREASAFWLEDFSIWSCACRRVQVAQQIKPNRASGAFQAVSSCLVTECPWEELPGGGGRQEVHFRRRQFLKDADDDMVLELAFAAVCHHIVTHNVKDSKGWKAQPNEFQVVQACSRGTAVAQHYASVLGRRDGKATANRSGAGEQESVSVAGGLRKRQNFSVACNRGRHNQPRCRRDRV